uniref:Uncharacterized protein n=1 Tax=Panagrolaimus davidi TaxID=227884 RepID=A0A914PBK3_9BILA
MDMHREDDSVKGIDTDDVGTLNIKPVRKRKPHQTFTFETEAKKNKKRKTTNIETPDVPISEKYTTSPNWSLGSGEVRLVR